MKFSNGHWLNKPGCKIYSPKEVYNVKIDGNTLILYAPCTKIENRGCTLGGPLITYKITSPIENIIRIQAYHYMGKKINSPSFEIHNKTSDISISDNEKEVIYSSGKTKAVINKEQFNIDFFYEDKKLTSSKTGSLSYIDVNEEYEFLKYKDSGVYMKEQLQLSVGEYVYGFGEKFTSFIKNGQGIDIWNEDGGTSTEQSYKSIPFYMTNRGYGVFVNHPEKVSFEAGSEYANKVQFSVPGEYLDYMIIGGNSMKEVLENYTALTGRPALPPAWSFGLWLTTSFTTDYDEETVNEFIDGMAERDIPLRVFHFDSFWMKEFNWCDFKWDERVFDEPKEMLSRLKEKGVKICVWINPYISQQSDLFEEGMEKGYFIKNKNGDVWQWDMWQPGLAIVDFTNPEACSWYSSKLKSLIDMGVDCFKTDFGERIPTDAVYFDGSDPLKMHNYYTYLYNKTVYETLKDNLGEEEALLFARSATAGSQQFPVHWGGDSEANYDSMAESLRGGLSLGMSGFGFWSHDIGGFESTSTADVYKRWVAFGLLSSHSRLHGSSSYRVPWLYDDEACDVVRFFTKQKCALMPYLYKTAIDAHVHGIPMMRSMVMEFSEDRTCAYLDRQYMLGNSILVAPIFNDEGKASYYLPEGVWTNYINGRKYRGGRWIEETHNYLSIPIMIRENSLIAVGNTNTKPDYDYRENVSILAYELKNNQKVSVDVISQSGKKTLHVSAARNKNKITIDSRGLDGSWSFILKNTPNIEKVDGGKYTIEGFDTIIRFSSGNCDCTCTLKDR